MKSREISQDLRNSSVLIAIIYLLDAINDVSKKSNSWTMHEVWKKQFRVNFRSNVMTLKNPQNVYKPHA